VYHAGLIKTTLLDVRHRRDVEVPPTYKWLAERGKGRFDKSPFIGVETNVGSTSHHFPASKKDQQYSFGCPRFFFRFNLTSAITEVPYAYVDWSNFIATNFYRTTFEGHLTPHAWENGPLTRLRGNINPFICCEEFIASRFVLAYKPNLDVAFIALDPQRVGNGIIDNGMLSDLGDNVLEYIADGEVKSFQKLPDNLCKFLKTTFA